MGLIIQQKALQAAGGLRAVLPVVRKRDRSLFEQLNRAMNNVVLNIAEADGNDAGTARARFASACGSAKEVWAGLQLAVAYGYVPGSKATKVDIALDEICAVRFDVAPVTCDVQGRSDFLRGAARGRKPRSRVPGIIPARLRDIQNHTLRSPLQLIGQRLVMLPNRVEKGNNLAHHASRSVVNILLLHQRLLGLGLGSHSECEPKPIPRTKR